MENFSQPLPLKKFVKSSKSSLNLIAATNSLKLRNEGSIPHKSSSKLVTPSLRLQSSFKLSTLKKPTSPIFMQKPIPTSPKDENTQKLRNNIPRFKSIDFTSLDTNNFNGTLYPPRTSISEVGIIKSYAANTYKGTVRYYFIYL